MEERHSLLSPWPHGPMVKTNRETGSHSEEQLLCQWEAAGRTGGDLHLVRFARLALLFFLRTWSTCGKVREGEVVGRGSQPSCVILESLAPGPKLCSSTGNTKGCNEQSPSFLEHSSAAQVLARVCGALHKRKCGEYHFCEIYVLHFIPCPARLFSVPHIDLAPWKPSAGALLKLTLCTDEQAREVGYQRRKALPGRDGK